MNHITEIYHEIFMEHHITPIMNGVKQQWHLWSGLKNPIVIETMESENSANMRAEIVIGSAEPNTPKLIEFCGFMAEFNNGNDHKLKAFYDNADNAIKLVAIQPNDHFITKRDIYQQLELLKNAANRLYNQWQGGNNGFFA